MYPSDTMDADKASSVIVDPDVAVDVAAGARVSTRQRQGMASIYGNSVNSSLFYTRVYVPHTNPALMGRVNTESRVPHESGELDLALDNSTPFGNDYPFTSICERISGTEGQSIDCDLHQILIGIANIDVTL